MTTGYANGAGSLPGMLDDSVVSVGCRYGSGSSPITRMFTSEDMVTSPGDRLEFRCLLDAGVAYVAELTFDRVHGIWQKRDRLVNDNPRPVEIEPPSLILGFSGRSIAVWCQESGWCRESQPVRLPARAAEVSVGSTGRTCSRHAPCFSIESPAFGEVSINLLPHGDWRATFRRFPDEDRIEVSIDRSGEGRALHIPPHGALDLGLDCLLQSSLDGGRELIGAQLQRYALDCMQRRSGRALPVAYNTWFDTFYRITAPRLFAQIAAAAETGCEVFVIDAGWYGTAGGDWTSLVGDWQENPSVFCETTLSEVAEWVRSAGMEFGLWMEPERAHPSAPVVREHPDWFISIPPDGTYCYPDLTMPQVRDWMYSEMVRVVEDYRLRWLKLDCNTDFGPDPDGAGHRTRLGYLYEMLDALAERFPGLILEGCASGGLRNDLVTASHFDTHFLSDTVAPVDLIRITMSSHRRLPPQMMEKWAVIYPTGLGFTPYSCEPGDTGDLVLCPLNAKAQVVHSYHLDLAVRAAMTGPFGVSGNIAGLSTGLKEQLARHIRFYKRHRDFIASSTLIPLTAVEPLNKQGGMPILQLAGPDFRRNMIIIYNLDARAGSARPRPVGLEPDRPYRILDEDEADLQPATPGAKLTSRGVQVQCEAGHSKILFIERVG